MFALLITKILYKKLTKIKVTLLVKIIENLVFAKNYIQRILQ